MNKDLFMAIINNAYLEEPDQMMIFAHKVFKEETYKQFIGFLESYLSDPMLYEVADND